MCPTCAHAKAFRVAVHRRRISTRSRCRVWHIQCYTAAEGLRHDRCSCASTCMYDKAKRRDAPLIQAYRRLCSSTASIDDGSNSTRFCSQVPSRAVRIECRRRTRMSRYLATSSFHSARRIQILFCQPIVSIGATQLRISRAY